MSTMIREVYEAFKKAGLEDEPAAAAATAISELRDEDWRRSVDDRLSRLEGEARLHRWMLGFNLAMTAAVLFKLLI